MMKNKKTSWYATGFAAGALIMILTIQLGTAIDFEWETLLAAMMGLAGGSMALIAVRHQMESGEKQRLQHKTDLFWSKATVIRNALVNVCNEMQALDVENFVFTDVIPVKRAIREVDALLLWVAPPFDTDLHKIAMDLDNFIELLDRVRQLPVNEMYIEVGHLQTLHPDIITAIGDFIRNPDQARTEKFNL